MSGGRSQDLQPYTGRHWFTLDRCMHTRPLCKISMEVSTIGCIQQERDAEVRNVSAHVYSSVQRPHFWSRGMWCFFLGGGGEGRGDLCD